MRWRKLGLAQSPELFGVPWRHSHAMVPTPLTMNDGRVRVFTTFCDAQGIGRPGWVDLNADAPTRILGISAAPLLDIGRSGTFDENGVLATCVLRIDDRTLFMYYVGFELGTRIRYRLLSGLAISEDNGQTFVRHQETPILERQPDELYFRGGPFVQREGCGFRMWYCAGSRWVNLNGKTMPVYELRHLRSPDGLHWPGCGETVLPVSQEGEHGFGRPWVMRDVNAYRLFYSIRNSVFGQYRLGFARSEDGHVWARDDAAIGLDVSLSGFDDTAIMYASVIETNLGELCFYNGNDFGRAGFAVALRED